MIIVTALACLFLSEKLHLGRYIIVTFQHISLFLTLFLILYEINNQLYDLFYVRRSIVGGVVVVTGLYLVVWGKSKEQKSNILEEESPQKIAKQGQQQLPITVCKIDDNVDVKKTQSVTIEDPTSIERQWSQQN